MSMAVVVSHAMRRFPTTPPDTVYSYGLRSEGSHKPWSQSEEGESALSRSMRYADPWLYGSVRASGGLLLAPALVLCACSEYLNGTKRSSKKGPTTCKKCKGTRLPLSPAGDATKFGTVRCYPTATTTTPTRAGTVRVSSSSSSTSRPSILPSSADPYDLMRRSRLSVSESTSQFRARSISPTKGKLADSRSHSATRSKNGPVIDAKSTLGRRSILECDINPYELMSSDSGDAVKDSSITLVNGQRIRVRPKDPFSQSSSGDSTSYEDVDLRLQQPHRSLPSKLQLQLPRGSGESTAANGSNNNSKKPTSPLLPLVQKPNEKESEANRFKSILKKRSATTFGDTDLNGREQSSPSPAATITTHKCGSSHFYLPMPGAYTPRKKVQFLVENEIEDGESADRNVQIQFCHENGEKEAEKVEEEREDEKDNGIVKMQVSDEPTQKACKLRRSESERFPHGSNRVVFHDTMALRSRKSRIDSRMTFGDQDLERLDGLSSKVRRNSPTKPRPNRPPPPPPAEQEPVRENLNRSRIDQDNSRKNSPSVSAPSKQKDNVVICKQESPKKGQNRDKVVRIDQEHSNKKAPSKTKIDTQDSKEQDAIKVEANIGSNNSCTITDNNDKKPENLKITIISSTNGDDVNSPPLAPPRKRSNNKQPVVNIVQTSSPILTPDSPLPLNDKPLKTIVQISCVPAVHKLQIKNEFPDDSVNGQTVSVLESPQRKTSIMITGDDCYCTVNVNDDVPLYQSSVVVKDTETTITQTGKKASSSVYICGNFVENCVPTAANNNGQNGDTNNYVNNCNNYDSKSNNYDTGSNNYDNNYDDKDYEPFEFNVKKKNTNNSNNLLLETFNQNNIPSSELLQELLKDPVEAVKRNLVPHVCGKSDVPRRQRDKKFNNRDLDHINVNGGSVNLEDSFEKLRNYESLGDDLSSEHSSSTQYELMDASSECYTDHSNRSSVTEEELANRTKFYELLADSAIIEVTDSEDHHYESIKANSDPIYEEIEIPPPLPTNPPPSSLLDDLHLDKEYTTRSIFEGASKYDILSYLVDAKERGIVQEDSFTFNFTNGNAPTADEDTKEPYNRASHMSTVSDSSEDNSLIMSSPLIEDKPVFQKAAEIERNDSGVGSETSKSSLSKYRLKEISAITCEDCETTIESLADDEPLICRKCAKKRSERKEIITEIVETEEKYSRDLQIILEEFYQPMLVAGLLTPDQLSAIFLNAEELLENSQSLAERLRDAVEIAAEQGDEDLLTVNIGKIFLEAAPMLHGFETYCIRQGAASLLLASLEKEKELLRIFLRVSQMENTMLRRMNLNSFLMVPVQRVTKYPLLLARLYKVTPTHHETKEQLKEAQHKIELHLNHMNSETKDVPSKLWRRIGSSSGRRSSAEMDLVNIKLRKIAVDVLEWNHDEAKFALEGKLLFTQPTDNNWRKGRTIKLSPVNALLVINGKPAVNRAERSDDNNSLVFSRPSVVREAALLLVRDKNGRYSLLREPLYLDRCVIAADPAWQSYFEVQELLGKDTFIFKAEDEDQTRIWYTQLQFHAQGMGAWRKRRNALANIMINGMGLRS